MKRRHYTPIALLGLLAPGIAEAQSDTRWSADIYGSGGWSANPYAGSSGQAGYVQLGVRPEVNLVSERNTLKIAADVQIQQYFRLYPTQDNYRATLNYNGRPAENLTTDVHVNYSNTISGTFFDGSLINVPSDPNVPPTTGADLGLFGSGNRRQTVEAGGGLGLTLSSRDQLYGSGTVASTSNSGRTGAADYRNYSGNIGYSRRVNARLKLGISGSASFSDYDTAFSNTSVYSGQGTVDAQLTEHWTLNGAVGVSHLTFNNGLPSITTVSGNLSLCSEREFDKVCLTANRAILPSSIGGTRVQSSLEANYNRRISPNATIDIHGAFTQSNATFVNRVGNDRYYAGSVTYGRKVSARLRVNASGFFRKVTSTINTVGDDYGGQVGFVYTIGERR